ncbi:MAG: fibronectin type III domain-containing protein, partial [Firmicutes bacterium]|nr:fibronectin type III domain-containing protein [Bacillota bacterium]
VSNRDPKTIGVKSLFPAIAVGSSGPVYLLWQQSGALKSSLQTGGTWGSIGSGPTVTSSLINDKPITALAVVSPSQAYAIIEADDGVRVSTNGGGGWSSTSLIGGSSGGMDPAAWASGDGNVHVAWSAGTSNLEVYYSSLLNADTSPPTAPSGLAVARSGSSLNLTWSPSADNVGVAGYVVERATSSTGPFSKMATVTATSYADSSVSPNVTYYYRVKAFDAAGNTSGPSNVASGIVDTQPPSAPTSLAASAESPISIKLTWSASTDNVGVAGYIVERASSSSGPYTQVAQTSQTSYTDTGLKPSTTYYYRVWAKDAAGNASTSPSNVASAKTKDSAVNDTNADSCSDAIAFYDYGGATAGIWSFLSKEGKGFDALPSWKSLPGYFDLSRAKVVTGDFNGDGRFDAIALYDDGGTSSRLIYFESSGSSFKDPRTVFSSTQWSFANTKLVSGDFNADSKDELFAFYTYGGTSTGVFTFTQNPDGTFSYPKQVFRSDHWDWQKTRLLSVKEKGKSKVIAAYDYGGTSTGLWLFGLDSSGNLIYPTRVFYSDHWNFKNTSFLTGDVNKDEKTDVIAFYNYGGTTTGAWVFYQNQSGTFDYPVRVFLSPYWNYSSSTFIPGDFNADGYSDAAAVYDYGGGSTGIWIFPSLSYPTRVYLTPYWDNKRTRWVMPY